MLLCALPLICFLWTENYGDAKAASALLDSCWAAGQIVLSNPRICALGVAVTGFESAMYAFVFNWTPTLTVDGAPSPPHGLIFSGFMMACMCGSCTFSFFNPEISPCAILIPVVVASAVALLAAGLSIGSGAQVAVAFYCFLIFEAAVGVYFPAMGTLKSMLVPERARAGVYNLYRVPLNAVVIGLLLSTLATKLVFVICVVLLAITVASLTCLARGGGAASAGEAPHCGGA